MSMGADRAEAQPQGGTEWTGDETWQVSPETESYRPEAEASDEALRGSTGSKLFAALLILLALGWVGASAFAIYRDQPQLSLPAVLSWIATVSVPLVLIGLLWLIFGRTSRRETQRFTRAVAAMRGESQSLESVLAIVAAQIEENRARVGEEAARLMTLGDEASDRLGRVAHYLARETAELDRKSQSLESAAANARVDIGVLLGDLPKAEEQARAAAEAMKEAGLAAHQHAGALEGHINSLTVRGREADEVVGGAAQRLGAHLARIDTSTAAAAQRMDEAAARMNAAVDGALDRASESVDQTRSGLSAQSEAMMAMVEQGRAAFEEAGAEASRNLAQRLDQIGGRIETLAAQLAAQDQAAQSMVASLGDQLTELDERIAAAGRTGGETHDRLSSAVAAVRASVQQLQNEVDAGQGRAGDLIERAHGMADALGAVTRQLREELPDALSEVEAQASRTGEAARAAVPSVEAIQSAVAMAAGSLSESEGSIARQREGLDSLLAALREGVGEAEDKLRALGVAVGEADGAAGRMIQETGPALIDALVRVREAANQAANHAREAIAAVIPESAAALADASRDAVSEAVTEPVREQVAELGAVSAQAVAAARKATERLTRQLLVIGETAAAIEARIGEDRAEREEKEAESLTRRVSLLIEALNSTAIDVTKILSNEITDTAWAAYLKGDRGVFARRAVRLLDSGEAREILRHYEEEPEFRDQVNRYVTDFEAMLRRVLADREGTPLGITLLSSDMGKLYVALAQAIERLRR